MVEVKMYSVFSLISILEEIQCLAVLLLYFISENENLNLSCINTAENETSQGRLTFYLAGGEIVIRCTSSIGKCVLCESMGSNLVK